MDDNKIECPNCGKKIVDGIPFCPYCGAKQKQSLNADEIRKNPYDILQISPDAENEVIEAAHRSLARKYHPDSGTSSVSEERMREINWAYGILSDPEKRDEWKRKHREISSSRSTSDETSRPSNKSTPTKSSTYSTSYYPPSYYQPVSSQQKPKKENNNRSWITVGIVISVVVLCIIVYGMVKSTSTYQAVEPTSTSTPTRSPSYLPITYTNKCSMTINTAIHYQKTDGSWITDGWWVLNPGETANVAYTINPTFYTYGISSDGKMAWEGEDIYQSVRGSKDTYGFKKTYIQDWEYVLQNSEYYGINFNCQ